MIIRVNLETGEETVLEPMTEANRKKAVEILTEWYRKYMKQRLDDG